MIQMLDTPTERDAVDDAINDLLSSFGVADMQNSKNQDDMIKNESR